MSDIGEEYKAYHEMKREEKASRYDETLAELERRGVEYELGASMNVIVAGRYELWASTHAWFDRKSGKRGRGIGGFYKMLRAAGIGGECNG